MDEPEDKKDKAEKKPRCDPNQLELLLNCSEKKDISDWNNWRNETPRET